MAEQQHIAAEQLCSLTGLSDRRHRQIAKDGYFPPPINGQYQMAATLTGLFRHYRELATRRTAGIEDIRKNKLAAECKLVQLEVARKQARSLDADTVKREWLNIILVARQKFLGLENKISTRLGFNDEQREGLRKEIEETLTELGKPLIYEKWADEIAADCEISSEQMDSPPSD